MSSTRAGVGSGSDREARHFREYLGQPDKHAVFGAEVVAPFGHVIN
jgi:hypothetical protein